MESSQLHSAIMRRVYYAYAVRLILHPLTVSAAVFAVGLWAFASLVFVARILESMSTRPVGELPAYLFRVVVHSDVLTLVVTAVTAAAAIYLVWYALTLVQAYVHLRHRLV